MRTSHLPYKHISLCEQMQIHSTDRMAAPAHRTFLDRICRRLTERKTPVKISVVSIRAWLHKGSERRPDLPHFVDDTTVTLGISWLD